MILQKKADAVVIGAGSAGTAAAYYLTRFGMTDVVVIDKHPPLSQTSSKSGENIRNWWPDPDMVALMNRSFDLLEEVAAETDNLINLERRGYLYVSEKGPDRFKEYLDHYRRLDVGPSRPRYGEPPEHADYFEGLSGEKPLSGADLLFDQKLIGTAFPHLSSDISVAIHARRAGSISAQQLGIYFLEQVRLAGGTFISGEVSRIKQKGHTVTGVEVFIDGKRVEIETGCVINGAGPFAPAVGRMLGIELPLFSVRQQKIAFQDIDGVIPRSAPFTIYMDAQTLEWDAHERADLAEDDHLKWLLEPLPGGLHVKPEGSGDSQWLKLGWAINREPEEPLWAPGVLPAFPELMLRGAARCVPGLWRYVEKMPQPLVHYAGYYTKTAENRPLIGPMAAGLDGAYIIGGLSGFGTMACCAAGELVARWATQGSIPLYAHRFSPLLYTAEKESAEAKNNFQIGEL